MKRNSVLMVLLIVITSAASAMVLFSQMENVPQQSNDLSWGVEVGDTFDYIWKVSAQDGTDFTSSSTTLRVEIISLPDVSQISNASQILWLNPSPITTAPSLYWLGLEVDIEIISGDAPLIPPLELWSILPLGNTELVRTAITDNNASLINTITTWGYSESVDFWDTGFFHSRAAFSKYDGSLVEFVHQLSFSDVDVLSVSLVQIGFIKPETILSYTALIFPVIGLVIVGYLARKHSIRKASLLLYFLAAASFILPYVGYDILAKVASLLAVILGTFALSPSKKISNETNIQNDLLAGLYSGLIYSIALISGYGVSSTGLYSLVIIGFTTVPASLFLSFCRNSRMHANESRTDKQSRQSLYIIIDGTLNVTPVFVLAGLVGFYSVVMQSLGLVTTLFTVLNIVNDIHQWRSKRKGSELPIKTSISSIANNRDISLVFFINSAAIYFSAPVIDYVTALIVREPLTYLSSPFTLIYGVSYFFLFSAVLLQLWTLGKQTHQNYVSGRVSTKSALLLLSMFLVGPFMWTFLDTENLGPTILIWLILSVATLLTFSQKLKTNAKSYNAISVVFLLCAYLPYSSVAFRSFSGTSSILMVCIIFLCIGTIVIMMINRGIPYPENLFFVSLLVTFPLFNMFGFNLLSIILSTVFVFVIWRMEFHWYKFRTTQLSSQNREDLLIRISKGEITLEGLSTISKQSEVINKEIIFQLINDSIIEESNGVLRFKDQTFMRLLLQKENTQQTTVKPPAV